MTRTTVLTSILALGLSGCMTGPRLVGNPPADYLEANSPPRVWATLTDGEHMVIDGPRVISDTVFGFSQGEEVSIPTNELKDIRVPKFSLLKSSIMPALVLGGATGAFVLIRHGGGAPAPDQTQTNHCKYDPTSYPEECGMGG